MVDVVAVDEVLDPADMDVRGAALTTLPPALAGAEVAFPEAVDGVGEITDFRAGATAGFAVVEAPASEGRDPCVAAAEGRGADLEAVVAVVGAGPGLETGFDTGTADDLRVSVGVAVDGVFTPLAVNQWRVERKARELALSKTYLRYLKRSPVGTLAAVLVDTASFDAGGFATGAVAEPNLPEPRTCCHQRHATLSLISRRTREFFSYCLHRPCSWLGQS